MEYGVFLFLVCIDWTGRHRHRHRHRHRRSVVGVGDGGARGAVWRHAELILELYVSFWRERDSAPHDGGKRNLKGKDTINT